VSSSYYPRNLLGNKHSDSQILNWVVDASKCENWNMEQKAVLFEQASEKIVPILIKEIRVLKERLELRKDDVVRD
jgi:hypothetical protein